MYENAVLLEEVSTRPNSSSPPLTFGRYASKIMNKSINIIKLWGVLDICSISWFIGWKFVRGEIPFYSDIIQSIETGNAFELPYVIASLAAVSVLFYISLFFSGIYLIKQEKIGAALSYIQMPFRLFTIIPPSIFFILWPIKHIVNIQNEYMILASGIGLICLSEALKFWSISKWHKSIKKTHNNLINRTENASC